MNDGRRVIRVLGVLAMGVWMNVRGAAQAEPPDPKPAAPAKPPVAAPADGTTVRDGYVWKDAAGVVRLGQAVIAMGVAGDPAWSISEPLATKLRPWLTVTKDSWTFWNYALERGRVEDFAALPKTFVRLRGREVATAGAGGFGEAAGSFAEARLLRLEPIDEEWVRAWRPFFTERASPWRVATDPDKSDAARRRFVDVAARALAAMRARPGPGDADRAAVKAIDAEAKVVDTFRRRTEIDIQRWLITETHELGLAWPEGLERVDMPPTSTEVQRALLESATKASFLAAVAKVFSGDLEQVSLVYYEASSRNGMESTSYASIDLARVRDEWDDATYARHRATTKSILAR